MAGQTAMYGLSSIIGRLLNYFLTPLYVYFYAPDEYGVVSEFYAYVAFFVVLLTFGMETTFFRWVNKAENEEKAKKIFNQATSLILIINGLFLLFGLFFSQSFANWMQHPEYQNFVIWFLIILVVDATSSMFLAKLRYREEAKRFAKIQLSSIGVNILLNVFFVFVLLEPENDPVGIGYIFLANLVSSLVKPAMLWNEIKEYRWVWDQAMAKALMIFAAPLALAGFAGIINETFDRILIKRLLMGQGVDYAEAQVGIYSANYKLSILITIFIQAYRYAAEPFFFSQEKNKEKDKVYSKVMTYFVIVVALIFLGISLNLEIFKWFMPNKSYWTGLSVVPVLLLANVCLGIYYNQSIWYKLANKPIYGAYIALIGAVITIGLNLLLIPFFGFHGAAYTTLITYFTMMVLSYVWGKRIYPIKYNLRKVFLYGFSAILLYFLGRLLTFENFWLTFILHNFFVLLFISIVMFMERPLQLLRKRQN